VVDEMPGEAGDFAAEVATGFAAGSRIAGYRLEGRIGRGGMAVVFRARDERLGRLVALKILAPALAADEAFRQRFIRESRAAAAVDDPHIIPVFEAGEADGVLFIAMRYVSGGDVATLLRRDGALSPGRAAAIISPVASALDAAHAAGLVHRDVKPANMLVDTREGRPDHVYLSDFGLSKGAMSSAGLTGTGQFLGTLDYIAPEQIEGRPVDGRADEYALACAAFELLTGAPPFQRDEALAVMYAQMSEPPPLLTSRRPELRSAADQVFARALAKAPGERYPSCRDFADALRSAFGLQPYDSGPGLIPAADHPRTEIAQQPARDGNPAAAARAGTAAGPAAAGPAAAGPAAAGTAAGAAAAGAGPGPGMAGLPTREARIPALPAGGDGDGTPPTRRRRGPRVPLLIAAVVIVIAVAIVIAAALGGSPAHKSAGSSAHALPGFPIEASSGLPPVTGDTWVIYQGGKDASARLHGDITGVKNGEVAQLYAQQFPYTSAPRPTGTVILHPSGRVAGYSFQVTPSLATRYRVELLRSSAAKAPLAASATRTVYVALNGTSGKSQACGRPVCHEVFHVIVRVPATALATELAKPWYPYFGLNLAPAKAPAAPKRYRLDAGSPHVSRSRRISSTKFEVTVTYSFRIGDHAYNWNWNICAKDTETRDGIGLPGSHGCGAKYLLVSAPYSG